MTFIDANVILQYIAQPIDPETQAMHDAATELFAGIKCGEVEATTSEAVLAEVAFILTSPRQYHLTPADAAAYLTPILTLTHLRLPRGQRRLWLRALQIWTGAPRLGFVDALTVAYSERPGMELATFDSDFAKVAGIVRWQPTRGGTTTDEETR